MANTDVVKHDFSEDEMGVGIDWAALIEPVPVLDDEEGLAARIALASVKLPDPKLVTKERAKNVSLPQRGEDGNGFNNVTYAGSGWVVAKRAFYNHRTSRLLPQIRLGKDL